MAASITWQVLRRGALVTGRPCPLRATSAGSGGTELATEPLHRSTQLTSSTDPTPPRAVKLPLTQNRLPRPQATIVPDDSKTQGSTVLGPRLDCLFHSMGDALRLC